MKPFNPECWYKDVCDDYVNGIDLGNSEDCRVHCAKYLTLRYLMENSNIPANKCKPIPLYPEECDIEAFRRLAEIKDNIDEFVDTGKNLYLTSYNTGNSKTSWSIKLMLKYFEKIWEDSNFEPRGVFIHVPTFLIKCKNFKNFDVDFERLKKLMLEVDLVIWDDIASSDISSFDLNQLSMYIDARGLNDLANIYTGNLPTRELLDSVIGTRLTSRIWNSRTEVIELHGGDRR